MELQKEDGIKATGMVTVQRFNSAGDLVEERNIKNLVVTVGKNYIASRMVGTAATVMSHMAVGTNNTTPVAGNTTLGTEVGRVAVTAFTNTSGTNTVTATATFPAGTGTGALVEAGIFNAASAGTMLCRTTFPVVTKEAGDSIGITWVVTVS